MVDITTNIISTNTASSMPTNVNTLDSHRFRLAVKRLPHVMYFSNEATLPDVSLAGTEHSMPTITDRLPGSQITFGDLGVKFLVDEDMKNYKEMLDWMLALCPPDDLTNARKVYGPRGYVRGEGQTEAATSDVSLFIESNISNPNVEFVFKNAWPTLLGSLSWTTQQDDAISLECIVSFSFTYFEIRTGNL